LFSGALGFFAVNFNAPGNSHAVENNVRSLTLTRHFFARRSKITLRSQVEGAGWQLSLIRERWSRERDVAAGA